VERMDDSCLAKIARDNRPQGVRSRGRPKKRWKEKSQRSSLVLNSGRTGVSLKRRLRRRRRRKVRLVGCYKQSFKIIHRNLHYLKIVAFTIQTESFA
jgi:hypothetical protein